MLFESLETQLKNFSAVPASNANRQSTNRQSTNFESLVSLKQEINFNFLSKTMVILPLI